MSEATKFHETLTAAGLEYSARSSGGVDIFGSHDSIKAANSAFHSHGKIDGIATNLRHWRDECGKLHAQKAALVAERDALRKALTDLVNNEALDGVRSLVAGWNGEGRADGQYERHPNKLGASLPKTNCGAVYRLDEAMRAAVAALSPAHQREEG